MATSNQQIYYPKLWWRIWPIIIAVSLWLIFLHNSQTYHFSSLQILLYGFLPNMLFAYALIYAFMTRLIVDKDGLQLKGIYQTSVKWEQILQISSKHYFLLGIQFWGVYYKVKGKDGKNQRKFLPLGHIIPRPPHKNVEMLVVLMGIDWKNFKETEFGKNLYQYAPQLFAESEA